jgi:hypothetical protein
VSTPEPEPMEDKTFARKDSTKKGSREKPRKLFRFSMKSAKIPAVYGESSCVKLLKFRKLDTETEITDEMETPEMDQDFPPEFGDEKKLNRWSKRKSYNLHNLNTPVKTTEKVSKVVLSKFCSLSENAMENTVVQIHKEEATTTEYLIKTGFLLKKPQKKPSTKLQSKKLSYFAIKSLPCNRSLIHHRNERRHL